jgi:hypothetical protein
MWKLLSNLLSARPTPSHTPVRSTTLRLEGLETRETPSVATSSSDPSDFARVSKTDKSHAIVFSPVAVGESDHNGQAQKKTAKKIALTLHNLPTGNFTLGQNIRVPYGPKAI